MTWMHTHVCISRWGLVLGYSGIIGLDGKILDKAHTAQSQSRGQRFPILRACLPVLLIQTSLTALGLRTKSCGLAEETSPWGLCWRHSSTRS